MNMGVVDGCGPRQVIVSLEFSHPWVPAPFFAANGCQGALIVVQRILSCIVS